MQKASREKMTHKMQAAIERCGVGAPLDKAIDIWSNR